MSDVLTPRAKAYIEAVEVYLARCTSKELPPLSEEEEDEHLDALDPLWFAMTKDEQAAVNFYAKYRAPK